MAVDQRSRGKNAVVIKEVKKGLTQARVSLGVTLLGGQGYETHTHTRTLGR